MFTAWHVLCVIYRHAVNFPPLFPSTGIAFGSLAGVTLLVVVIAVAIAVIKD